MEKKILTTDPAGTAAAPAAEWLQPEDISVLAVTSEDPAHPVENIFHDGAQWRAAEPGRQRIEITFPVPRALRRIQLEFVETEHPRTQEFVLRWSPGPSSEFRDLVRQQWNFSPGGSTREIEDFRVELAQVARLEIAITPDVASAEAFASLDRLRLA
jgi:hypothetical protein